MYFQSKFTLSGKGWSDSPTSTQSSSGGGWCFRLRFSTRAPSGDDITKEGDTGLTLRERISRATEARLELMAQNLPLNFYLSTLSGLGDLVEDEVVPTPLPMQVRMVS